MLAKAMLTAILLRETYLNERSISSSDYKRKVGIVSLDVARVSPNVRPINGHVKPRICVLAIVPVSKHVVVRQIYDFKVSIEGGAEDDRLSDDQLVCFDVAIIIFTDDRLTLEPRERGGILPPDVGEAAIWRGSDKLKILMVRAEAALEHQAILVTSAVPWIRVNVGEAKLGVIIDLDLPIAALRDVSVWLFPS
jgi:hypothetical protein